MYATEGIVLKKMDIGEADMLYAIYTRDYGKVRAVAQGIRKAEAKLRGHLEPLSLSAIRFIIGRGGEKLIAASLIRFYGNMRSREMTLGMASAVAAEIDQRCFPGERDDAVWDLVRGSFELLDADGFPDEQASEFLDGFRSRLSVCLGYGGSVLEPDNSKTVRIGIV